MVFLHEKKRNNKSYYYLRKSVRKKQKVMTKDLEYLGNNFKKIDFKKLERKYGKEIKKQKMNINQRIKYIKNINQKEKIKENKYFTKKQLVEIKVILDQFKKIKNSKENIEKIKIKFIRENSALDSIEETFLDLKETKKLLKFKKYPKNKSIIHANTIINTNEILNLIEKEKPKLNLELIKKIPKILLKNYLIIKEFREKEIALSRVPYKISKSENIKSDLKLLLKWYNKEKNKIHPLALVALFHNKFEKIHPFSAGNGGTGRIIMNYMLSLFNYPPIIIEKKLEKKYWEVMDKACEGLKKDLLNTDMKYYQPLINFMHKQFVKTYWENFL